MRKRPLFNLFLLTMLLSVQATAQELLPSTRPNRTQQLMMERGYGMFIHFGINTFSGHEWSDGTTPASLYHPTRLDCDQWVRVARDAGFRYVLLTTKHHDGFCLWDSRYTDYDVASSPVKTDVVKAVADACRRHGLQFGIYYSLWDRHEPSYKDGNPDKYVQYMCDQLTELLTGYGEICELWFDGGWDREVEAWQLPRLYRLIKKLQPHCAVGVNHTIVDKEGSRKHILPDSMTVDNRFFMQYFPSDFRLWDPKIAHKADKKQYLHHGESYYLPFEHTVCISKEWNWFQKEKMIPTRDLDELEELFYWCTVNGDTLVVNIPPDKRGLIRENEANAIIQLGRRLGIEKGAPLPTDGKCISMHASAEATSILRNDERKYGPQWAVDGGMQTAWMAADTLPTFTIHLDEAEKFNKISIFELCDTQQADDGFSNIRRNRISSYQIDMYKDGEWTTIYTDNQPMGDCKVIRLPQRCSASQIRLKVLKAAAPPALYEFCVTDSPTIPS